MPKKIFLGFLLALHLSSFVFGEACLPPDPNFDDVAIDQCDRSFGISCQDKQGCSNCCPYGFSIRVQWDAAGSGDPIHDQRRVVFKMTPQPSSNTPGSLLDEIGIWPKASEQIQKCMDCRHMELESITCGMNFCNTTETKYKLEAVIYDDPNYPALLGHFEMDLPPVGPDCVLQEDSLECDGFSLYELFVREGAKLTYRVEEDSSGTVTFPPFYACGGGDDGGGGAPQISDVSPSSGPPGTPLTILGSGLSGATSVTVGGVGAPFEVISATEIHATVPAGAGAGPVVVSVGTQSASGGFSVTASIGLFLPMSGDPGSSVMLTGLGFSSLTGVPLVTQVTFNGTPASFTILSPTQLSVTVPLGATSGPIAVVANGFTSFSSGSFSVGPALQIASLSPAAGPVGSVVSIQGAGFGGVTSVRFNGVSAYFSVVSATRINAFVPASATSGPISVWSASGSATSPVSFQVVLPPSLAGFSPASGAPGEKVVLVGNHLSNPSAVRLNGVSASVVSHSSTAISVEVPAGASTGRWAVTTAGGTTQSGANFTFIPPLAIASASPAAARAGALVEVTGGDFLQTSSVTFNGVPATFIVLSSTSLRTTVPQSATSGPLRVTRGTRSASISFEVIPPLVVTGFSPSAAAPGTSIQITGNYFQAPVTAVYFAGTPAAGFQLVSSTTVSATVPFNVSTGPIQVVAANGTSTSSQSFVAPPVLNHASAWKAHAGAQVFLIGSNFAGTTSVRFHQTNAQFVLNTTGQITATVPVGAQTGRITIVTPGGTATSSQDFEPLGPLSIASFSPAGGPPGTLVTVAGQNLNYAQVFFDGLPGTIQSRASASVSVLVPAGAKTNRLRVIDSFGGDATSSGLFYMPPALASFSPGAARLGYPVTLTGTNLEDTVIRFNGVAAVTETSHSTSVVARVPRGATSGTLSVTNAGGTATLPGRFVVIRPVLALGSEAGTEATAALLDERGIEYLRVRAYEPSFQGGARVALCDFNDDGVNDLVTGPGPGRAPTVRIRNGQTGDLLRELDAYNPAFTGGIYVAAGDVNGDGTCDIVTGAGRNGGPHVRVFDGRNGSALTGLMAYDVRFTGGVRVAAGDVNGDGKAEVITAAGPGGGPHVRVLSPSVSAGVVTLTEILGFMAYGAFGGGVFVAAGDVNADGRAEIITGADAGGGPHVRAFISSGAAILNLMAYGSFLGGVRVGASDLNGDGKAEVLVAPGASSGQPARAYNVASGGWVSVLDFGLAGITPSLGSFIGGQ